MRDDAQTAYLFQCGDEELSHIARQDRQEYSTHQLHAGLAATGAVPLGRPSASAEPDRHDTDHQKHH